MVELQYPEAPTFLIIGAHRAATRWLRINLGYHPNVFVLPYEAEYFTDEEALHTLGPSGYMKLFKGWQGEPFVGESSHQYSQPLYEPAKVAGRIYFAFPNVRILFIIRNPYDRAFSAMLEAVRRGQLPPDSRMDQLDLETLQRLQLFDNSAYEWTIGPFQTVMEDKFKVLVYDDLLADPQDFYDQALEHIGLEPGYKPKDLNERLYSSRRMRTAIPEPDAEHRRSMLAFWEKTTEHTERLLGRELPGWHPS